MSKKIILIIMTTVILYACTCSLPAVISPTVAPPLTATPSAGIPPATLPADPLTPVKEVTLVRLLPDDGELMEQIRAEVPNAIALGQAMFVEFDASW